MSERYTYTAYGQPTFLNESATVQTSSAAGNRCTYTAREWDPSIGLQHFRARWMSGLIGRFLGRDPIGYDGGESMYILSINFDRVDSRGTLDEAEDVDTVDIDDVTRRVEKDTDSVAFPKSVDGIFVRSENWTKTGKPCNGYIIQEVTVKCERSKCSPGRECGAEKESDSFTYYEALYIGRSAKPESDVGYTDEAYLPLDSTESCGDFLQEGRLRFFCQSVTGDLGRTRIPISESGRNAERNFGSHGACPTGAAGLPATKDTPVWWDRGVEVDLKSSSGSAYRDFHVKWNCCCLPRSQRKAKVTSLP